MCHKQKRKKKIGKTMSTEAYTRGSSLSSRICNFKEFVRESSEPAKARKKAHPQKLNFKGDEARSAYEQIINRKSESLPKNSRKNLATAERHRSRVSRRQNSGGGEKHAGRVTANCILRAVEKGDLEYLAEKVSSTNVDISDDYGWTPLMSAAFCGNYKIVEFLLKLGANTGCRDKSGFTAGGLASKKNYSGIVALLRESRVAEASEAPPSSSRSPGRAQDRRTRSKKEFYCSICRESFRETTLEKHETSMLHVFNTRPKLPGAVYSIPKQNRGYQIMLKRGWREEGLGPEGQGSKFPVKTVLKRDRRGFDEQRKEVSRVTHFRGGDSRAVATVQRPRERTLRRRDRERLRGREAQRDRALRRALS